MKKIIPIVLIVLVLGLYLFLHGRGGEEEGKITLTFAHTYTGGQERHLIDQLIAEYEISHPDVKIKQNVMDDDTYTQMGLTSLFTADSSPDIYFQWSGWQVDRDAQQGFALDLTEVLARDGWREGFFEVAWTGSTYQDRTYMVPISIEVSNLIWYNRETFSSLNLEPPADWTELMKLCRLLKQKGIIPLGQGNRDLWTVGNWAAHLVSRMGGENFYHEVFQLNRGTSFINSEFVKALDLLGRAARADYFNEGLNGLNDSEGKVLFYSGKAAMHFNGSWLIPESRIDAPRLDYSFFNTPPVPGGQGDQESLIGVITGLMVGQKSQHREEAMAFLRYFTSPPIQRRFVEGGTFSPVKAAYQEAEVDSRLKAIRDIFSRTKTLVPPPDTGFNPQVAHAFYGAAAQVVGRKMTPLEALRQAEDQVKKLRR